MVWNSIPSSVLVDPEEPDLVKGRQLGHENEDQAHEVDDEVQLVVFGVSARQDEQNDRKNREELSVEE